jgi:hypothetical protein
MLTKTKIALAAALLASTASMASAQARATGIESAPSAQVFAPDMHERFWSAPARLRSDRAFMPDANQVLEENNWFATNVADHASSPYAGGGGR